MTNTQKLILAGSISAIAIVGTVLTIRYFKKKKDKDKDKGGRYERPDVDTSKTTTPTNEADTTVSKAKFPLKKGDYNNDAVKIVQKYLNTYKRCQRRFAAARISFPYPLSVDGDFGKNTKAALEMCLGITTVTQKVWERMNRKF